MPGTKPNNNSGELLKREKPPNFEVFSHFQIVPVSLIIWAFGIVNHGIMIIEQNAKHKARRLLAVALNAFVTLYFSMDLILLH